MRLGRHLRELAQLRVGLAISVALALLAAMWSVERVSLFPPGIKARPLEMASAKTRTLVDSPTSSVLDLSVTTYDLNSLTNRALLVGNVMASAPVRGYIARRSHVPEDRLRIIAPVTQDFPRQLAQDVKYSSRDILKSPDEYRISIQVNPTVPVLDVYTQAPSVSDAKNLANGAIDGMKDYLASLGRAQRVPPQRQVHLEQLGRATGGMLNRRVEPKVALLSFVVVLGLSCLATVAVSRIRRGWASAGPAHATTLSG
jgi:hypothetical protein